MGTLVSLPEGGHETVASVLCSLATCPQSGKVLKTREDNVVTVDCPDGTRIVEHADGTRITTFHKQVVCELQAPDNETGEQAEYLEMTKTYVKVECTGFATVIFDVTWVRVRLCLVMARDSTHRLMVCLLCTGQMEHNYK